MGNAEREAGGVPCLGARGRWTRRVFFVLLLLAIVVPVAAAISFRSASSAEASGTSLTLTKPASLAENDVMVAVVSVRNNPSITPPSGWTQRVSTADGSAMTQVVYTKVATASEPASYTWTLGSAQPSSAGIAAYSGVDATAPYDASAGQANVASTSVTASAVTTAVANEMVVGLFGTEYQSSFTPPSGMTERADVQSTSGLLPLDRTATEIADVVQASASSTGAKVATAADSAANVGQLLALRPPSVAFSSAASSGSESSTTVNLAVALSGASSLATTLDYAVTGGSATGSGTDFTLASGTLTFAAGTTSLNVVVTVNNDALDEVDETIVVTLSNPGNANLGATTSHTYTISDDDPSPTVTLGLSGSPMAEAAGSATVTASLSAASGRTVTVDLAFSGTATLTDDYARSGVSASIGPGSTSGSITLTAVQDALDEAAETVIVDVETVTNGAESGTQQVTASIADDDPAPTVTLSLTGTPLAEAAGGATVTASLSAASGQSVTVNLAFAGTATLTSDYTRSGTSITVTAGGTTGSVTLTAVQDSLDEAAETVMIDIDTVANGAESGTQQVTATITDDDAAPTVTLGLSGSPMEESAGSATVTATLSGVSGLDVTVNLAFAGTATLTSDYTRSGASITVTAGSTTGSVTLTAVQDALIEPAETVVVDIDTVTNGAESGTQQVSASITSDDAAGLAVVQSGGTTVAAEGLTDSFTVALTAQPTSDVQVSATSANASEATLSLATLTFTAGNWNTAQTVTVTGVQDNVVDGDKTVPLALAVVDAASADEFDPVADVTVSATITDSGATGGGGGGGGGGWSPNPTSGADRAVVGYPVAPQGDAAATYQSSVPYAPADTSVEIVMPDAVVPSVLLSFDRDLERAEFQLVRRDAPPVLAPLPTGSSALVALELELSGDEALASAHLQLRLPVGDVEDPERVVWAHWGGSAWQPLHRVGLACDATTCSGEASTTHFSLFALLFDDEAPVVSLDVQAPLLIGATVVAQAVDNLGDVARVEFFVGGALASTDDAAPFQLDLPPGLLGRHEVRAVAWDIAGNSRLVEEWVTLLEGQDGDAPSVGNGDEIDSRATGGWPSSVIAGATAGLAIFGGVAAWGLGAAVRGRPRVRGRRHGVGARETRAKEDAKAIPAFTHRQRSKTKSSADDVATMLRRELRR